MIHKLLVIVQILTLKLVLIIQRTILRNLNLIINIHVNWKKILTNSQLKDLRMIKIVIEIITQNTII